MALEPSITKTPLGTLTIMELTNSRDHVAQLNKFYEDSYVKIFPDKREREPVGYFEGLLADGVGRQLTRADFTSFWLRSTVNPWAFA